MNEQVAHLGVGDRLKEGPAPELTACQEREQAAETKLLERAKEWIELVGG